MTLDRRVLQDHQETPVDQEPQDLPEPLDLPDLLAARETRDSRGNLVLEALGQRDSLVLPVQQVTQGALEIQDLQALKVHQVTWELLGQLDQGEVLEQLDHLEHLEWDCLDLKDPQVLRDPQETLVDPDPVDNPAVLDQLETLEQLDQLGHQGPPDLKDLQEVRDLQVLPVIRAIQAFRVLQDQVVPKGHQERVNRDLRVLLVQVGLRDNRVRQDHLVLVVRQEIVGVKDQPGPREITDPRVHRDLLETQVLAVIPDHKDQLDRLDPVVIRVRQGQLDLQDPLVLLVLLETLEVPDNQDLLDHLELMAHQVSPVRQVLQERRALRAMLGPQAQLVPKEAPALPDNLDRLEIKVPRVRLELLDQLDL